VLLGNKNTLGKNSVIMYFNY